MAQSVGCTSGAAYSSVATPEGKTAFPRLVRTTTWNELQSMAYTTHARPSQSRPRRKFPSDTSPTTRWAA